MLTLTTVDELQGVRSSQPEQKTALVPTMGHLHAGHNALIEAAKQHASFTVVSIFVNPLQFNDAKDFETYPRTLDEDIAVLEKAGVDALFAPSAEEFYPPGQAVTRKAGAAAQGLCGDFRPGHFNGVVTVLTRLFEVSTPDIAVFGRKDYQQLCVIKDLVQDLGLDIEIIAVATQRDPRGLALSSRNSHLSDKATQQASYLYRTLKGLADSIASVPSYTCADLSSALDAARLDLSDNGFKVEYIEARAADDLAILSDPLAQDFVILAAVWLDGIRLIDNINVTLAP